jgi:hypothetical protein
MKRGQRADAVPAMRRAEGAGRLALTVTGNRQLGVVAELGSTEGAAELRDHPRSPDRPCHRWMRPRKRFGHDGASPQKVRLAVAGPASRSLSKTLDTDCSWEVERQGSFLLRQRRGWDSNPRGACTPNGFQDRPVRPLRHPAETYCDRSRVTSAGAPKSRSTSGTPPWKFSRIASAMRSTTAVPFRVWTISGPCSPR